MRDAILTQDHHDLGHLARHMTDIMHRMLQAGYVGGTKPPDWTPAVDVCETDTSFEVIVELAGVRREDIEVYTENRHLMITGFRRDPTSCRKVRMHQMEIEEGQFRRQVRLPPNADEDNVSARCHDGLLRIKVPKKQDRET